jgi:electron-transferring-flavoprotein dehydrogenase
MTSVALTGTNHAEDQPVHLRVMTAEDYAGLGRRGEGSSAVARKAGGETGARRREHVKVNVGVYAGLLERACPAGVYEYVDDDAQVLSNFSGE